MGPAAATDTAAYQLSGQSTSDDIFVFTYDFAKAPNGSTSPDLNQIHADYPGMKSTHADAADAFHFVSDKVTTDILLHHLNDFLIV